MIMKQQFIDSSIEAVRWIVVGVTAMASFQLFATGLPFSAIVGLLAVASVFVAIPAPVAQTKIARIAIFLTLFLIMAVTSVDPAELAAEQMAAPDSHMIAVKNITSL
jgi:hypothetical protein